MKLLSTFITLVGLAVLGLGLSFLVLPGLWFQGYEQASKRFERMLEMGETYSFRSSANETAAAIGLVAQEDRRIYSRTLFGLSVPLDMRSCARAVWLNLQSGSVRQGCSTLAMQLGKMSMDKKDRTRSLWYKLYQLRLSLESLTASPDAIVSAFLHHLPCASTHAAGLRACSLLRLGKDVEELNQAEAMVLASAVQSPGRDLQPTPAGKRRAKTRLGRVLNTAWEIGLVTREQAQEIFNQDVVFGEVNLDLVRAAGEGRDVELTRNLSAAVERARSNALRKQGVREDSDLLVLGAIFDAEGRLVATSGGDESWLNRKMEAGSWVKPFLVESLISMGAGEQYLDGNVRIPLSLPLYTKILTPYYPRNAGKNLPERAVPMQYIMKSINTATLASALYAFVYLEPNRVHQVIFDTLSAKERRKYNSRTDRNLSLQLASKFAGIPLEPGDIGTLPGYRQMTVTATRRTMQTMKTYIPSLEVPHEDLSALLGIVRAPWKDFAKGLQSLWITESGELSRTARLMSRYAQDGTLAWMKKLNRQPPDVYKTATATRNAGLAVLMHDQCNPENGPYLVTFLALRPSGEPITPIQGGTLGPAYLELDNGCLSGNGLNSTPSKSLAHVR